MLCSQESGSHYKIYIFKFGSVWILNVHSEPLLTEY